MRKKKKKMGDSLKYGQESFIWASRGSGQDGI